MDLWGAGVDAGFGASPHGLWPSGSERSPSCQNNGFQLHGCAEIVEVKVTDPKGQSRYAVPKVKTFAFAGAHGGRLWACEVVESKMTNSFS